MYSFKRNLCIVYQSGLIDSYACFSFMAKCGAIM